MINTIIKNNVLFKSRKRKIFFLNSFILIFSSIVFRIISIFFNSYIVQLIGTEALGIFNICISVYSLGITIGCFGISLAVTKIIAEELSIKNYNGIKKISNISIFLSFIIGLITSILFFIFSKPITHFGLHNKLDTNIVYVMLLAFPFISMSSAISGYFVAVRRVYKSTILQFFEQFIKIGITILLLKFFLIKGSKYACFSLILGDLISEIFSFLSNYILYLIDLKKYKTSYNINYPFFNCTQKILKISTPIAISSLIRSGLSTIKQVIIPISFEKGLFDCSKAFSVYGEINGMAMPIIFFSNVLFSSISGLLIPEFSTYKVEQNKKSIKNITKKILFFTFIISNLISVFLFIFSDQLCNFVYKNTSVSIYIKLLSPMTILILIDCVTDNILKGLDAQNYVMIINIIDTFIDIILIFFLVPNFGITGYIITLYISETTNLLLSLKKLFQLIHK